MRIPRAAHGLTNLFFVLVPNIGAGPPDVHAGRGVNTPRKTATLLPPVVPIADDVVGLIA